MFTKCDSLDTALVSYKLKTTLFILFDFEHEQHLFVVYVFEHRTRRIATSCLIFSMLLSSIHCMYIWMDMETVVLFAAIRFQ